MLALAIGLDDPNVVRPRVCPHTGGHSGHAALATDGHGQAVLGFGEQRWFECGGWTTAPTSPPSRVTLRLSTCSHWLLASMGQCARQEDGRPLRTLQGHTETVRSLAVDRYGTLLSDPTSGPRQSGAVRVDRFAAFSLRSPYVLPRMESAIEALVIENDTTSFSRLQNDGPPIARSQPCRTVNLTPHLKLHTNRIKLRLLTSGVNEIAACVDMLGKEGRVQVVSWSGQRVDSHAVAQAGAVIVIVSSEAFGSGRGAHSFEFSLPNSSADS